SLWTGLSALAAARKAAEGASQAEVAQAVREATARQGVFFFVDTLEYLVKGGRIGKAQGFVGGVLNIKPILYINDGELHQYGRVRTRRKAVERIIEIARAAAPLAEVGVLHGAVPDEAQALAADLADLTPGTPPIVSSVGPAVGTHTGPGALGVAFRRA
ncbi:MAG: DegV family EDD domain-containing protein, partial [Chloroflexota bacterium]|nr:DegV family EDD domain-containing protein [Chloroflexota bacterium]